MSDNNRDSLSAQLEMQDESLLHGSNSGNRTRVTWKAIDSSSCPSSRARPPDGTQPPFAGWERPSVPLASCEPSRAAQRSLLGDAIQPLPSQGWTPKTRLRSRQDSLRLRQTSTRMTITWRQAAQHTQACNHHFSKHTHG